MESKSPLQSKTLWLNAILAAIPQTLPVFESLISPELYVLLVTVANAFLRFVSNSPLKLQPKAAE